MAAPSNSCGHVAAFVKRACVCNDPTFSVCLVSGYAPFAYSPLSLLCRLPGSVLSNGLYFYQVLACLDSLVAPWGQAPTPAFFIQSRSGQVRVLIVLSMNEAALTSSKRAWLPADSWFLDTKQRHDEGTHGSCASRYFWLCVTTLSAVSGRTRKMEPCVQKTLISCAAPLLPWSV